MLTTISTKNMPQEAWLAHRRNAIGGSDAAAIIGLNNYSTPFRVWADKLGKLPPQEENEAMRLGHDLEEYVAKRFTEATGKKVRRRNAIIYNDQYPFAHANIDREIVGENAILECKTTSKLNIGKFANGNFPVNYYVQVMHYMAVTGAQKAYIAVLVLQEGFYWYEVNRDEDEISALMTAEQSFWEYVTKREEPPVKADDVEIVSKLHPVSDGTKIDLFGRASELNRYLEIKQQIKALETEEDEIAASIKQQLGDSEAGADGAFKVSWKSYTENHFDKAAFQKANPNIDLSPYMKTITKRPFKVSKI